jgi:hypothetical protein
VSQHLSPRARLTIGDRVRVTDAIASEYAGRTGIVVAVEERGVNSLHLSECEIEFADGVRRRFLGFHLTHPSEDD